ncbi:hypothetical protein L6164_034452 [Bauhinia variegata]|uniref:Uncharacterized protein n=1 Tax=Bauhinia variegata TaxID=167791 RepID=A0ACB9KVI2_BAUVA|nr:hypothetical protein L6164_034452 [Bauhinia variegata]
MESTCSVNPNKLTSPQVVIQYGEDIPNFAKIGSLILSKSHPPPPLPRTTSSAAIRPAYNTFSSIIS